MYSFQAIIGLKKMRKGENKNYRFVSFRSYPTRNWKFQKNSNKIEKIKIYHYGFVSSQNRLMHTKELDMLIIQVEMKLNLHKTLCHFLVAQLQDLEPNVSRKH